MPVSIRLQVSTIRTGVNAPIGDTDDLQCERNSFWGQGGNVGWRWGGPGFFGLVHVKRAVCRACTNAVALYKVMLTPYPEGSFHFACLTVVIVAGRSCAAHNVTSQSTGLPCEEAAKSKTRCATVFMTELPVHVANL